MPPVIKEDLCTRCHTCCDVCSEDVFFGSRQGEIPLITYPEECWHCNACVLDCPAGAITLRIPLPLHIAYREAAPDAS